MTYIGLFRDELENDKVEEIGKKFERPVSLASYSWQQAKRAKLYFFFISLSSMHKEPSFLLLREAYRDFLFFLSD